VEQAATAVAVVERRAGNRGKTLVCKEVGGAFTFELRLTDPGVPDATATLAAWEMTAWGRAPKQVQAGVGLLAAMSAPNELDVSLDSFAGEQLMVMILDEAEPIVPVEVAEFVDDLAVLQPHCTAPLAVPGSITQRDVRRAREAARLVRGTIIDGTWAEGHLTIDPKYLTEHVTTLAEPHAMALVLPYETEVGGQVISLGDHLVRFASVRAADSASVLSAATTAAAGNEGVTVTIVPGDDDRLERLWPAPTRELKSE
jgi:hypothetical protein